MKRSNQSAGANLGADNLPPQHPHAKGFVHTHSESQLPSQRQLLHDGGGGDAAQGGLVMRGSEDQMLSAPPRGARGRRGSCPKIHEVGVGAGGGNRNGSTEELASRDWQNNLRRRGEHGESRSGFNYCLHTTFIITKVDL